MTKFIQPKLVPDKVVLKLLELGVSQAEISRKTGRHRNNVANWVKGYYQPQPESKPILNRMLADALQSGEVAAEIRSHQNKIDNLLKN